jgi:CcmD family protein
MSDNTTFVAAAFAITWVVMLGYLLHLRRASRRARTAFDQATRAGA